MLLKDGYFVTAASECFDKKYVRNVRLIEIVLLSVIILCIIFLHGFSIDSGFFPGNLRFLLTIQHSISQVSVTLICMYTNNSDKYQRFAVDQCIVFRI